MPENAHHYWILIIISIKTNILLMIYNHFLTSSFFFMLAWSTLSWLKKSYYDLIFVLTSNKAACSWTQRTIFFFSISSWDFLSISFVFSLTSISYASFYTPWYLIVDGFLSSLSMDRILCSFSSNFFMSFSISINYFYKLSTFRSKF